VIVRIITYEKVGEKFTEIATLWTAAMVKGKDIPLTVNSGLVVVADATTTHEPDALRVVDIVWLDPTATLPIFVLARETAKVPPAVALPESGMVRVLDPALDRAVKLTEGRQPAGGMTRVQLRHCGVFPAIIYLYYLTLVARGPSAGPKPTAIARSYGRGLADLRRPVGRLPLCS
jgi:hypothetical protein